MKDLTRRSLGYKEKVENRYWWFKNIKNNYIPPIFQVLTDVEWSIIEQWYRETDLRSAATEANIPAFSLLQGLISGNNIKNIVQLGHHEGLSTLLFGFMMRQMGHKNSVFTIDVDTAVSEKTKYWISRANLQEYVKVAVGDSSDEKMPQEAMDFFKSKIDFLFIDSSSQYAHTIKELNLWYDHIKETGLIALHDISEFASQYDHTKQGGVNRALKEWSAMRNVPVFFLNGKVGEPNHKSDFQDLVYKDGCGMGLIQKN